MDKPRLQCRQCKQTDTIYGDAHGKFCRECGPSVPVDLARGLLLAARGLAARPAGLRGPFSVDHELVERLAAVPLPEVKP